MKCSLINIPTRFSIHSGKQLAKYENDAYKEISEYNTKITDLDKVLKDKENRYYEKFSNMEKVMSQLNSQSNWLSSQLASLNSG